MTHVLRAVLVVLTCVVGPLAAWAEAPLPAPITVPTPGGDVTILADRLEAVGPDDLLVATGNVEITRGTARLLADRVELNRATGDAVAQGRVIFYDGEDRLTAERIDYNVRTGTGVVYRGQAHTAPYYRIAGERMERLSDSVYRVYRGIFTTCEDEGAPAWSFRFGSATADLESYIWGTSASFWIKQVPVIPFVPFFAAAIRRERQTGFLFPRFGSSSNKGLFVEIPFYWAISDSQDATVALDAFERRGFGGSAEYRYVLSEAQRGALSGFWVRETERSGAERVNAEQNGVALDRGFGSFKHDWQIAPGFGLRADANVVADDFVLREYRDLLQERSRERAESNLFLTKTWDRWSLVGNVLWYQDLTVRRPVELQRVPEIRLEGVRQPVPGLPGFLYQVSASATHFVRDVGSDGTRVDLHPRLAYPLSAAGYFTVTPFVGGRLTGYDRTVVGHRVTRAEGHAVEVTEDEVRLRRLWEVGSDLEARATRVWDLGGAGGLQALVHAIEPRLSYIRLGGRNIARLPNWTELIDRIPEASWLEYSVTNRLRGRTVAPAGTEASRLELVRFLVAHAWDIQNERPGNLVGDLILQPTERLRLRSDLAYNLDRGAVETATTDLAVDLRRVGASAGTRYTRQPALGVPAFVQVPGTWNQGVELPERASVSFLQGSASAELWRNLTARASTNFDLRTDRLVENRFALDFRFQCWAFTVEYIDRSREEGQSSAEDEFRFALNLLGIGAPIRTTLGVGGR